MGLRPANWPQGFRGKGHTCALFWVLMAGWLGTEAGRRQAGGGETLAHGPPRVGCPPCPAGRGGPRLVSAASPTLTKAGSFRVL